jgi:hypothetical protein
VVRLLYIAVMLSQIFMLFLSPHGLSAQVNSSNKQIKQEATTDQGKKNAQQPVLHVSPREIDLGIIGPGEGIRGNFVLKNVGSGVLNWSVNGSEGWSFFDEKKLSGVLKNNTENLRVHISFLKDSLLNTEGTNLIQLSIEVKNRINIYRKQLSFGAHREMIKLSSNGGTRTIFVRFELSSGQSEPQIRVEPPRIDFGAVRPGESVTRRIKVTNRGKQTLRWQVDVQGSADSNGNLPVAGRYIAFLNEDIKGTALYAPPASLKEIVEFTGKWSENNGYPSSVGPSNTIKYRFWGTGVAIFFSMENGGGSVVAYVDEKNSSNPECRAGQKEKVECLVAEGLPYGSHVLTIVNQGNRIVVEGARVYGKEVKRGKPGWISIFPDSGRTTKEIDYVNIVVNTKHLDRGYYGDTVVFDSNGGEVAVEVSLEVSEDHIQKIVDIYRFASGSDYLFTANPQTEINTLNAGGYRKQGIAYRLFSPGTPGTTPFYRWYNDAKKDHFYSHDPRGEGKTSYEYVYEGTIGNIATSRLTNTRELYRWYNPSTGSHFYSTDPGGEAIIKKGYRFDGIAGYVR